MGSGEMAIRAGGGVAVVRHLIGGGVNPSSSAGISHHRRCGRGGVSHSTLVELKRVRITPAMHEKLRLR